MAFIEINLGNMCNFFNNKLLNIRLLKALYKVHPVYHPLFLIAKFKPGTSEIKAGYIKPAFIHFSVLV